MSSLWVNWISPFLKFMRYKSLKLHTNIINALRSLNYCQVLKYEASKMPPHSQTSCYIPFLRRMRSVKFLFLVSCTSFAFSLFWVQLATRKNEPAVTERLIQEALENVARDYRYKDVYRKKDKLPKDFKYILLWPRNDYAPFNFFGDGQKAFLENNCSVVDCYVTANKNFFGGNLTKFDVIAFNGRNLNPSNLPKERSPHQKYMFANMESADYYPVCDPVFDGYFNWTATYRLDSDIPIPYILIRNSTGQVVGPKQRMQWKENMSQVTEDYAKRFESKSKAAAWFVSHCYTRSNRQGFVQALKKSLKPYGFTVDVYGYCGSMKCPREKEAECDHLLKRDYFFYLSLENSFDIDYVTEKLLTALQHDLVPIVYGGADYSRFLPPNSYINGRRHSVVQLAALMDNLMHSPEKYSQYFQWKPYYTYHNPSRIENVCKLCEALHNKEKLEKITIYENFRKWWHPHFKNRCQIRNTTTKKQFFNLFLI